MLDLGICKAIQKTFMVISIEQLEDNNVKALLELSYNFPNIDELKTMTVNIPFEDVKCIYNG